VPRFRTAGGFSQVELHLRRSDYVTLRRLLDLNVGEPCRSEGDSGPLRYGYDDTETSSTHRTSISLPHVTLKGEEDDCAPALVVDARDLTWTFARLPDLRGRVVTTCRAISLVDARALGLPRAFTALLQPLDGADADADAPPLLTYASTGEPYPSNESHGVLTIVRGCIYLVPDAWVYVTVCLCRCCCCCCYYW